MVNMFREIEIFYILFYVYTINDTDFFLYWIWYLYFKYGDDSMSYLNFLIKRKPKLFLNELYKNECDYSKKQKQK